MADSSGLYIMNQEIFILNLWSTKIWKWKCKIFFLLMSVWCVFRHSDTYSVNTLSTCLAPNFHWWQNIRLAHKQNHFHKHIIIRQIKHTGDLCAPLPKHKSTSSKSFKAPSGCVPWQLVLLLNQHMCFYWNYIGHFRYTVRPQKTIIRPRKTIVSPVQNAT